MRGTAFVVAADLAVVAADFAVVAADFAVVAFAAACPFAGGFLPATFFAAAGLVAAAGFVAASAAVDFAASVSAAGVFAAGFVAAGFVAAGFVVAGFVAAGFVAAGFVAAAGFLAAALAARFGATPAVDDVFVLAAFEPAVFLVAAMPDYLIPVTPPITLVTPPNHAYRSFRTTKPEAKQFTASGCPLSSRAVPRASLGASIP